MQQESSRRPSDAKEFKTDYYQDKESIPGSEIIDIVHEFLLKNGYFKTLDVFQEEILTQTTNLEAYLRNATQNFRFGQSLLLEMFDRGSREGFFQIWNRLLSPYLRQHDAVCQNVEFYLMVYFAVYPVHPINPNIGDFDALKREIEQFKLYLDSKGSELSSLSEFLPFYALPYIKNPHEHPSFTAIFTREWAEALRKRLEEYLNQVLPSVEEPKLYKLWEAFQRYDRGAYSATSERLRDSGPLKEEYVRLQKEYQSAIEEKEAAKDKIMESQANWTLFSKDILAISKELYKAIIAMKNKQKISDELLLNTKTQIDKYESFLNTNQVIFHEAQSSEQTPRSSEAQRVVQAPQLKSPSFGEQIRGIEIPESLAEYPAIDYKKVKQFLLTSNDDLKLCATLQALRWRITRNRKRSGRLAIMSEYVREDLLGCDNNGYILERLLEYPNRKVVDYTVALLDELVAENLGTQYLTEQPKTMPLLAEILTSEEIDTPLMKKALATIEKCSVRRKAQTALIQLGLIPWILAALHESDKFHLYTLEYITALLMNLALRSEGRKACQDPKLEILKVLSSLLDVENIEIRSHINGTLYSILAIPELRIEAKRMGLPMYLNELKKNSSKSMARQIEYIMNQLNKPDTVQDEEEAQSDEEEPTVGEDIGEEEYSDAEEVEIDRDIVSRGIPTGETLLLSEFGLGVSESAMRESKDYDSSMQQPIAETEKESDKDEEKEYESLEKRLPKLSEDLVAKPQAIMEEVKNFGLEFEAPKAKPGVQEIVVYPSISETEKRLPTPIVAQTGIASKEEKAAASPLSGEERVPTAMQSRPKIPRTPIPEEKLEQVKKENELIRRNAMHVYVNEGANIKKRKMVQNIGGGYMGSSIEEPPKGRYENVRSYRREEEKYGTPQQLLKGKEKAVGVSQSVPRFQGVPEYGRKMSHKRIPQRYVP